MSLEINTETWGIEFKNQYFLHPKLGVCQIVMGWSKPKAIYQRRTLFGKKEYLTTIETLDSIKFRFVDVSDKVSYREVKKQKELRKFFKNLKQYIYNYKIVEKQKQILKTDG